MTNLVEPGSDNKVYGEYVQCFLFWERILEQTAVSRSSYNHGVVSEKNKDRWMQRQREYLVPLLKRRMRVFVDKESGDVPMYIDNIFNHFCDWKSSVNLSCIGMEIEFMVPSLREILLQELEDGKFTVNVEALTVILPNVRSYVGEDGVNVVLSRK